MQYELLLDNRPFTMVLNNFARDCKHDVTNKLWGKSKKMGCSKSRGKAGTGGDHSTSKDSLTKQGTQSHRIKQGQAGRGTASIGSRQGKVQSISREVEGRTGVQATTQIQPSSWRQNQRRDSRGAILSIAPRSTQEKQSASQDSRRESWVQVHLWYSTGKGLGTRGRLQGSWVAPGQSGQGN